MAQRSRWVWRALVGGLILGLPAGALLFVRVPVLNVIDVTADRRILVVQVRAGESLVVSYRSGSRGLVSETFEVASDDLLVLKETTIGPASPALPELRSAEESRFAQEVTPQQARQVRLQELSLVANPSSGHTLVVKGRVLVLSREVDPGSVVIVRVAREFWWRRGWAR